MKPSYFPELDKRIGKQLGIFFPTSNYTPFPVSPRGEKLLQRLPPWVKVGMGVKITK